MNNEETIKALEQKYSDRGLKFTTGFEGYCPTQAYGYIDGKRFYFRDRHEISSLTVGMPDRELDERVHQRRIEIAQHNLENRLERLKSEGNYAEGDLIAEETWVETLKKERIQEADDIDYYPHDGVRVEVDNLNYPNYLARFSALVELVDNA